LKIRIDEMRRKPQHAEKQIIPRPARGRPSKLAEERLFELHGALLAEELRSEPLRSPVDSQFEPYYQQLLQGNARAILRYCDEHWERDDLSSSFFELLGRLFMISFYRIAATSLANIARRRTSGSPSKRKVYEHWYRGVLKPRCDRAREFLREAHRSGAQKRREELWRDYCFQPAWPLETEVDKQHHEKRTHAIEELIDSHGSTQSSLITTVHEFGSFGLVPKEIFFDLALSRAISGRRTFSLKPAQVARKYACRIMNISESTASHYKNVRN
jgi:hypothetical protein